MRKRCESNTKTDSPAKSLQAEVGTSSVQSGCQVFPAIYFPTSRKLFAAKSHPSRLLEAKCAVCGSKEGAKVNVRKRLSCTFPALRRRQVLHEYGPQTEGTPVGHYCKNHSTQAKRDAGRKSSRVR